MRPSFSGLRGVSLPMRTKAQQGARANDHGCHVSCSEQHEPHQPRSWLILNVGRKLMHILRKILGRTPKPPAKPREDSQEQSVDVLIRAAADSELPRVAAMVERSFLVDAKNDVSYTPLMAAARSYRLEVVR